MYTDEQIIEAAEAAVKEKGADFVYRMPEDFGNCVYAEPGKDGPVPSCLVGHIVARLIPESFPRLAEWDESRRAMNDDTDATTMIKALELPFTEAQVEALRRAQETQDNFLPWEIALKNLKERLSA